MKSTVILTEERLHAVAGALSSRPAFAFDVETSGANRGVTHLNNVTWISFAAKGIGCTIPMGHPLGTKVIGRHQEPREDKNGKVRQFWVPDYEDPPPQLQQHVVFEVLRPVFFKPGIIKIADDITFDIPTVSKYFGEVPPPPYDDPKVTDQLLDENLRQYGLKERTKTLFGVDYDQDHTGRRVEIHPFGKVARYSYMDAMYTWLRWVWGIPQIAAEGLEKPHAIEKALMSPLIGMRLAGAPVNVARLEELRDTFSAQLVDLEADIYRAAGVRFNINSTRQLQQLLYGKGDLVVKDTANKREFEAKGQGIKPWKLTGGGAKKKREGETPDHTFYSVDDEALQGMEGNVLADALRAYGDKHKLLSTYVLSWLGEEGNPKKPPQVHGGKIFTHFKQYGTVTGRLSSAAPNVQNIPRPDKPDGKLMRGIVEAPDGELLVTSDYGQIELVTLAHLIGYGALYDGFWNGIDPHTVHAAGVLNKDVADVTKDERQRYGKTLGFTIVNGAGVHKVASMIGGTKDDATALLEKHEEEFPEIYEFKEAVFALARSRQPPYVRTLMGRKRRVPNLTSKVQKLRMAAERQTFNTLIQGGAADLIKLAMIETDRMLGEQLPDAYLSLTVHDELVAVAPEAQAERCREIMVEAMTGPAIQRLVSVPLKVDAKVVKNWSQAK